MEKIIMVKVRPSLVQGIIPKVEVALSVVELEKNNDNKMLDFCYKEIGCDLIEYATFGDPYEEKHFNAIVDEEGLLKSGNIAMSLELPINNKPIQLDLCGTVLLSKSKLGEEGLEEVGLTMEEVEYISKNLEVKVIGVTR